MLNAIFKSTQRKWGQRQVHKYLEGLELDFTRLASQPDRFRLKQLEIGSLKIARTQKHYTVYEVLPGAIVLLEILHQRQDLAKRLVRLEKTLLKEYKDFLDEQE